ncbi:uncharacterized protein LOC143773577 [Ranitomeya variabilis]|uniref:uncharacterized protein LOC143773577 n=1 Tax=Ranitomeya variabilis TaxID=490064 RepID=UPI0040571EB9
MSWVKSVVSQPGKMEELLKHLVQLQSQQQEANRLLQSQQQETNRLLVQQIQQSQQEQWQQMQQNQQEQWQQMQQNQQEQRQQMQLLATAIQGKTSAPTPGLADDTHVRKTPPSLLLHHVHGSRNHVLKNPEDSSSQGESALFICGTGSETSCAACGAAKGSSSHLPPARRD